VLRSANSAIVFAAVSRYCVSTRKRTSNIYIHDIHGRTLHIDARTCRDRDQGGGVRNEGERNRERGRRLQYRQSSPSHLLFADLLPVILHSHRRCFLPPPRVLFALPHSCHDVEQ
jgi:hypothetical protein